VVIQNVDNMGKVKASQILKKGVKIKARKIDINDPEIIERFNKVREKQKALRDSTKFTIEDLRKIVITI
jgi:hypothetical protein